MPANPHFYLNSFLRGLVTATTDEVFQNADQNDFPSEIVGDLAAALDELTGILIHMEVHLREEEEGGVAA